MIEVPNISSSSGSGSIRMMSTPGYLVSQSSTARWRRSWDRMRKTWLPIPAKPMSETRRARAPNTVGICLPKSLMNGTSGLTTTMNFAPCSTAMSTFVVERIPPSTNWRPRSSTGV